MVCDIYYKCWEFNIQPAAKWKGREEESMVWADLGSRGPWNPNNEFSLDFNCLQFVLGSNPVTIDTMATYRNRVVPRYVSLAFEVEAEGLNFFEHRFAQNDYIYIFPPPRLI